MDQTPRPDESRDDHQDHQRDLGAEFAVLMGDVDIPSDLSTENLGAVQETDSGPGRQTSVEDGSVSAGFAGESGPADIRLDDVPHNTCCPLSGGNETIGDSDRSRLTGAQEAQIAAAVEFLNSYMSDQSKDQAPRTVKVAIVTIPLNRANGLAGTCSLLDLDCTVASSPSGVFAVKQFASAHSDWDVAEPLGGSDSESAEVVGLVVQLSRLSQAGVVLMTADLVTDIDIESDLSGTIIAHHFISGQPDEEASTELLLVSMDQVVEDVLLGVIDADDVPGAVGSSETQVSRATRWFECGPCRPSQ